MKQVRFLDEATQEAVAAAQWYDQQRSGLGDEFSDAIDAAIDLIEEGVMPLSPLAGLVGIHHAKRLILKRFPYDIVVVERAHEHLVVAIAHHSRKPGYWKERTGP